MAMAEEDYESFQYKDISDLKRQLEEMKGKKDISNTELHNAVQKLGQTITNMLDVFGAAAEQMKLEEKEYESNIKKHDIIISKLDKIIDQNRTIAEGMVAIVELVKEKFTSQAKETEEESFFKPKEEPQVKAIAPEWQPKQVMPQVAMPNIAPPVYATDFGMQMPPMQPEPSPNLDLPEEPFTLEEEPRKKSLFGMFKK